MYPRPVILPRLILALMLVLLCSCQSTEQQGPLKIGDRAPDFMAKDLENNIVMLNYYKNKPVLLRFFETDCKYCRADTPIFNRYFEKYKEKGLRVVYISTSNESKEEVVRFIKDLEVAFPVVMDDGAVLADLYNILFYPQTIIIDPNQVVVASLLGGVSEPELQELVGQYLDTP